MSSDPHPQLELAHDRDQAARTAALNTKQSFIVQAPAGSGKTELLIQRYLALLATVDEPESVVAITFTRKAAGEMRARVLKALAQAELGEPKGANKPEKDHEKLRRKLTEEVLARDLEKGWQLKETPSRLRIATIDSLCHGIVKLMPWTSELGVPRSVVKDAEADLLHNAAAHRTVQLLANSGHAAQHLRRALVHLDNNVPQLEALLASMLKRRDQWLRHMPKGETRELRAEMESTLRRVICGALEKVRDAIPVNLRLALVQLANLAAENLQAKDLGHPIGACLGVKSLPECSAEALSVWCGLASVLLTDKGKWRAEGGINAKVGFPPEVRPSKQLLVRLIGELSAIPGLETAIHSIRALPPGKFSDSQWEILESFAQLLPIAVEQLRSVFIQEQACDFSEVAQAAQVALGNREAPTDLALSLGHDIRHLLVDEFQDTSISQVRLLQTLMAGWKPDDGRTLFLVGDPMQSIYRFRQAEVGSFLRVREAEKIGSVNVEALTLTKNFRSRQAIVDWVNKTFPVVFPAQENIAASAVLFEKCESAAKDRTQPSVVHTYAQFGGSEEAREQEATDIVALIRDLRVRKKKVAILVRGRNHLFSIVPKLREACESDSGLRFQAVEIDALAEQIVIGDLRALTNALLHLGHRVAWLAILRAPWCGLLLNDLHALCGDGRPGTIWELLQQRSDNLSQDGHRRLERILPALAEALQKRGRLPLRHWVEATWMSLNGPACLREPRDLEDASAFFDLLDELDCGSDLESLAKLEDSISRLFARPDPEAGDAIQIMTIHKAKGLEFDAVVLPGLGRYTRGRDRSLILWDERSSPGGSELLMAAMPPKGGDRDNIYDFLQSIETERGDNELRRLLYVAATRAKHELHLFGHIAATAQEFLEEGKEPDGRSFLALLWHVLREEFIRQAQEMLSSTQIIDRLAAATDPAAQRTLRRLPLEWVSPALPSSVDWSPANDPDETVPDDAVTYDWAGERARRVGTVVHAMLQRIAEDGLARWSEPRVREMRPALRSALANQGVSPADMEDAIMRVGTALLAALADDRGRWVLQAHPEAQNEYSLTGLDCGQLYTVAMDRTFVADGVRWIVDYKTSAHEGGDPEGFLDNEIIRYKEKMDRYARILKKQDARPIRIGLYFPLMRGWREWGS